jgi:hypothetical protein
VGIWIVIAACAALGDYRAWCLVGPKSKLPKGKAQLVRSEVRRILQETQGQDITADSDNKL